LVLERRGAAIETCRLFFGDQSDAGTARIVDMDGRRGKGKGYIFTSLIVTHTRVVDLVSPAFI
jgi:hypothetical protein